MFCVHVYINLSAKIHLTGYNYPVTQSLSLTSS
jgi:hypothetical protein